jgi:hypothetical protein
VMYAVWFGRGRPPPSDGDLARVEHVRGELESS